MVASLGFMPAVSTPFNAIATARGYPAKRMMLYGIVVDVLGVIVIAR